jgi:hypothetical protein
MSFWVLSCTLGVYALPRVLFCQNVRAARIAGCDAVFLIDYVSVEDALSTPLVLASDELQ